MLMDPKKFIAIWQSSSATPEVSKRTGLTTTQCSGMAHYLRRHGVPLQKFPRGPRGNKYARWSKLAELAKSLAEGEE